MPKVLFVINSKAGKNAPDWEDIISNYFTEKTIEAVFLKMSENFEAGNVRKDIDAFEGKIVVAVGGDGTVNMVAQILHGSDKLLGILPAGSANGMARELNIPIDPQKALSIIEKGAARWCDAILINNKDVCLHLSDIGLNAQLVKYFDEGKFRGQWGYARVILKALWYKQKIFINLQSGSTQIKREAFMV
ncbi:MAG: diacylglycerol kinase family lipid kinase, partial [Chitinophagaceae bacterium]